MSKTKAARKVDRAAKPSPSQRAAASSKPQPKPAKSIERQTSGRASDLYRLLHTNPPRAKSQITSALKAAGGRVDKAADTLGVSSRTLSRWLGVADMREVAADLRRKNKVPGPRA